MRAPVAVPTAIAAKSTLILIAGGIGAMEVFFNHSLVKKALNIPDEAYFFLSGALASSCPPRIRSLAQFSQTHLKSINCSQCSHLETVRSHARNALTERIPWCSDNGVGFNYSITERNLMPFYQHVAQDTQLRVLVYNGGTIHPMTWSQT